MHGPCTESASPQYLTGNLAYSMELLQGLIAQCGQSSRQSIMTESLMLVRMATHNFNYQQTVANAAGLEQMAVHIGCMALHYLLDAH